MSNTRVGEFYYIFVSSRSCFRNVDIVAEKQWLEFGGADETAASATPPEGARVSST